MTLRELIDSLPDAKGYMIAATILGHDDKLTHNLITSKFPLGDLLPSLKHVKDLAIEQIENPTADAKDTY